MKNYDQRKRVTGRRLLVLATVCALYAPWAAAAQTGDGEVLNYLPSINELYDQAQRNGISTNWTNIVEVQSRDYASMGVAERAFNVGITMSNVAFLLSDLRTGEVPAVGILEEAKTALSSLNPGPDVERRVQSMIDGIRSGSLTGNDLRVELDDLVGTVFPSLTSNESTRDAAELALASAFFRAMYLGASTVAGYDKPERSQLAMFRWAAVSSFFVDYFTKQAGDDVKSSPLTQRLVVALQAVQKHMSVAPEKVTKSDVSAIANILKPIFG